MKSVIKAIKKAWRASVRFFKDPALDVLGGGVMASLMGRTALYSAMALSFFALGQLTQVFVLAFVVTLDVTIHGKVLSALRKLMGIEAREEIKQQLFLWPQQEPA